MIKQKQMKKNKFSILIATISLFSFASMSMAEEKIDNTQEAQNFKLPLDNVDSSRFYGKAVLQILNKTTAKTAIIEAKVGELTEYGKMTIAVRKCWQAPLDQKPDSRILLEIFENKSDGAKNRVFFGWMISSSPSISSLEHPVYDVVALSCKNK